MKQAIIDIGSNSIRLTLYEIQNKHFKILFREKIMAGLAGYVEDGKLSNEGIECACNGLLAFKEILDSLQIDTVSVFATASLRNIFNTKKALSVIKAATGFKVEIISGDDEALLGYAGAMEQLNMDSGAFLDIGGASTEIVTFDNGEPIDFASFPVGSLSLYRHCVKKILPKESAVKHIKKEIDKKIDINKTSITQQSTIIGVGGTNRAALKFVNSYYKITDDSNMITTNQLDELCAFLSSGGKEAIDMILKLEPERIHTIVPGLLILQYVFHLFGAEQMIISKYGVREGYLCKRILKNNTNTHKTGN